MLKLCLLFPLNFLNSIIKTTSNQKIVKKKLILLVSKKLNPMVDERYDLLATVTHLYSFSYNQHVETSIIQLTVIPFCRVHKIVHDTETPLKCYLCPDNPNGFSFSNYQQVFINLRKIEYFDFPEHMINAIHNHWSLNFNLFTCLTMFLRVLSLLDNGFMNTPECLSRIS